MVPPDPVFAQLMEQVRAGDADAARILYDRYGKKLSMVIRRKLPQQLRGMYDTIDFAQDVWVTFFHTSSDRYLFATPEELVAFLTQLANNKVVDTIRQRLGARGQPPLPLHEVGSTEAPAPGAHANTPSKQAIAQECLQRLKHNLYPRQQEILDLLRLGHTHQEVADRLHITTKEIQRLLRKLEEERDLP